MEDRYITEQLQQRFTHDILETDTSGDMLTIIVTSPVIHDVIAYLKENENLGFTFLTDLCGIHYPDRGLPLGVIYHLHNLTENKRIRIKTYVTVGKPNVQTMTDIFATANWMERETYDFYGIIFDGHPDLKRILNVDYMDYFPLRKEYPLEDATREDKNDKFFGR
ncbi:MAG: NADH-quinone oxidoreductase subunit C [Bacteroidetes bacterium]|nr:NADH-quinone oxidoreductase subunit C [Bacteroidota bacterium]